jgi:hypothetical protein
MVPAFCPRMEGFLVARVVCELSCSVAAVGDTLVQGSATGSGLLPCPVSVAKRRSWLMRSWYRNR